MATPDPLVPGAADVGEGSAPLPLRRFADTAYERGLSAWGDLVDLDGLTPLASSLFGDVLLLGADGVWLLDLAVGALEWLAADLAALEEHLRSPDGMEVTLLAPLAEHVHDTTGLWPTSEQVFAWRVPPILGGEYDPANCHVLEAGEAMWRAGHAHAVAADEQSFA